MSGFAEYDRYDAVGLADLVRNKQVHPRELVEAAIERIEQRNPALNAVIHVMYDEGRRAASARLPDGPFAGVPFLLKDLLCAYAGVPLRSGSRFFDDYVPQEDSELVRRYRRAGLVFLGKTNTPELGLLPVTEPRLFGPTRNPWNPARTPGGSSGGSAAAVAARMVPLAHATDGGGSIRIPASCCGLFGLKPTRGRTPSSLDFEPWQGFACEHVLTRSVRDSAAMLDATAGPDVGVPCAPPPPRRPYLEEVTSEPGRLRIAFSARPLLGDSVDGACLHALQQTVTLLEGLGHELVEDALQLDAVTNSRAFLTVLAAETRAAIDEAQQRLGKRPARGDLEAPTRALSILGGHISAADLVVAMRRLQRAAGRIEHFLESYDLLLTPTLAKPPVETGTLLPAGAQAIALEAANALQSGWLLEALHMMQAAAASFRFSPYTPLINVTGQPAMSVPLYWTDDGLPIGMHFVGHYADEATLFRLAGQLERAHPWAARIPPLAG